MDDKQIDVLSVGDMVTDAFIRLDKSVTKLIKDGDSSFIAIPYGTKIPFEDAKVVHAVGNSANASVSFARLGLKSALVSNVGNDEYGRDMITYLKKAGVDTRFVDLNPGKKSNYHYVLWYKDDRTILINHETYDYEWKNLRKKDIPKWVYYSSVSQNAVGEYCNELVDWLDENPDVKLAFQPGTYQLNAGTKKLSRVYKRSEVLAVNREEAVIVSGGDYHDINDLFDRLHALGPKIVVISDGPSGAYASDGVDRLKMPIYPDPSPPYERTGAGDAFTSTFVAAIIRGSDIAGALQWAPINSMSVVQYVGAQEGLLKRKQIENLLERSPAWYRPQKLRGKS